MKTRIYHDSVLPTKLKNLYKLDTYSKRILRAQSGSCIDPALINKEAFFNLSIFCVKHFNKAIEWCGHYLLHFLICIINYVNRGYRVLVQLVKSKIGFWKRLKVFENREAYSIICFDYWGAILLFQMRFFQRELFHRFCLCFRLLVLGIYVGEY